jgi:hypothetical protein
VNKSHPGRWPKYTPAEDGYLTELWLLGHQATVIGQMLTRKFGIPRSMSSVRERRIVLKLPARQPGVHKGTVFKPKTAKPVQKEQLGTWIFEPKASVNHSIEWKQIVALRQAELRRAWAHAARVKPLGPVGKAEAEALIAAALAAGRVTQCPPRFVARTTGGPSL